jgi:hypothetical protein
VEVNAGAYIDMIHTRRCRILSEHALKLVSEELEMQSFR